ncbi:MAG: IS200/IS605 family transposase [Bacteroidetes bacterium]|nr:IS200/IS605 family transposase [Bacteroidota bacterium]
MAKRGGTYSRIFLHYVWTTKNRVAIMDEEIKRAVIGVFAAKAKELNLEIIEANGPEDHMHVLLKSPPTLAASDIAKELKGSSSHFVNHVTLQGDPVRSLYWQDGFGVISVGPSAVKSVGEYIRRQVEHHRDHSVNEDYEI